MKLFALKGLSIVAQGLHPGYKIDPTPPALRKGREPFLGVGDDGIVQDTQGEDPGLIYLSPLGNL